MKNKETHYGYKNHISIGTKTKLIRCYTTSSAEVHDSQTLEYLLGTDGETGQIFHADSAYTGERCSQIIEENDMVNKTHEKGTKNNPLTDEQKASNKEKSKKRARVEHVFGFIEGSMNRLALKCIGFKRACSINGLINLTYNLFRYEQIIRLNIKH